MSGGGGTGPGEGAGGGAMGSGGEGAGGATKRDDGARGLREPRPFTGLSGLMVTNEGIGKPPLGNCRLTTSVVQDPDNFPGERV